MKHLLGPRSEAYGSLSIQRGSREGREAEETHNEQQGKEEEIS